VTAAMRLGPTRPSEIGTANTSHTLCSGTFVVRIGSAITCLRKNVKTVPPGHGNWVSWGPSLPDRPRASAGDHASGKAGSRAARCHCVSGYGLGMPDCSMVESSRLQSPLATNYRCRCAGYFNLI